MKSRKAPQIPPPQHFFPHPAHSEPGSLGSPLHGGTGWAAGLQPHAPGSLDRGVGCLPEEKRAVPQNEPLVLLPSLQQWVGGRNSGERQTDTCAFLPHRTPSLEPWVRRGRSQATFPEAGWEGWGDHCLGQGHSIVHLLGSQRRGIEENRALGWPWG